MTDQMHSAHWILACLWLLALLAEPSVELRLKLSARDERLRLARLRWRLTLWVSAPAAAAMLFTGARLLAQPHAQGRAFQVMVTAGLLAVFFQVFLLWLNHRRHAAARAGRLGAYNTLSGLANPLGLLVLLAVATALAAGVSGRGAA